MSAYTSPAPKRKSRFHLELVLVIGLPILSIFVGSTLAITAYVKGFSPLPEPAAQVAHHH